MNRRGMRDATIKFPQDLQVRRWERILGQVRAQRPGGAVCALKRLIFCHALNG